MIDPLYLPSDERLATLEVDVLPGQAEQLPATQPEREQQDVPGLHRVTTRMRRLEEPPRLVDGPHRHLLRPRHGYPHERGNVAEDELLAHCLGQNTAEHPPRLMDRPVRGDLVAARAQGAALWLGARGILALEVALAADPQRVHPYLNVADHQLVELAVAEVRDVQPRASRSSR